MQNKNYSIFKQLTRTYSYVQLEAKRHHRSTIGIIIDMARLYIENGIGPNYYILAGMAEKTMSWQVKCQHLSNRNYHKALDILNPKPYRKLTQHKLNEKAFLTLSKIPTADFIGFYHPVKGFDSKGNVLTNIHQLSELLSHYQEKKICIKLLEGSGGVGFFAGKIQIDVNAEIYVQSINKKETQSLSTLLAEYTDVIMSEGLLLEAYIEQSDKYAQFNPSSVNTVRTWVLQQGSSIKVIGALFRIGRKNSSTDNSSAGGHVCPIDIKTGKLTKGLTTMTPYREEFTQHLDSGVQFDGEILEQWQEIVNCSCETLRKLPYTRFVGLDVCMTVQGPLIIEVNVAPDKDGAAHAKIPSYLLTQATNEL